MAYACVCHFFLVLLCPIFEMRTKRAIYKRLIYALTGMLFLPLSVYAEHHTLHAEADRPGAGTGTNVLDFGVFQWETGFEVMHIPGLHVLTLPTTLFRFGLHERAELRLEYTGGLALSDHPDGDPQSADEGFYYTEPLCIGTKLMLWPGSEEPRLHWIPRTSLMLNVGLPLTKQMADRMPIAGTADLLFENDITDWLTVEYEFGTHWREWAPMPDFFVAFGLDFEATDKLGFFVENYDYFDCDVNAALFGYSTAYDVNIDFGVTYSPIPRVQLDAYAGFNCYHTLPEVCGPKNNCYFGFGVTWLYYSKRHDSRKQ